MLTSVPQLSPSRGQQSPGDRNESESHHLSRSAQICSTRMLTSQEALPSPAYTSPPLLPKLSVSPCTDLLLILPHIHMEFDQTWLLPLFPFSPTPSTPLNPASGHPPSHSLDGMKHRQTHPRGRQLVGAETVTERERRERWWRCQLSRNRQRGRERMEREAERWVGVRRW